MCGHTYFLGRYLPTLPVLRKPSVEEMREERKREGGKREKQKGREGGRKSRREERRGKEKEIVGEMGEGGRWAKKRAGEEKVGKRKRLYQYSLGIKKSHLPPADFRCFQA